MFLFIKTFRGHISGKWIVYQIVENLKAFFDMNEKKRFVKIKNWFLGWFFDQNRG